MHFIRHGQSAFNAAEHAGDPQIPDAPLTEKGFAQARRAAQRLVGQGVTDIVASPYTRAIQTASTIAAELGAQLHIEPLAGERALYSCDIGTPKSRLRAAFAHLDFSAIENENWWPETGESSAALSRRAAAFKDKWRDRFLKGSHALVSHWYFLNALTGHDFENGEVLHHPDF